MHLAFFVSRSSLVFESVATVETSTGPFVVFAAHRPLKLSGRMMSKAMDPGSFGGPCAEKPAKGSLQAFFATFNNGIFPMHHPTRHHTRSP